MSDIYIPSGTKSQNARTLTSSDAQKKPFKEMLILSNYNNNNNNNSGSDHG